MKELIKEFFGSLIEAMIIVIILFFIFWPVRVKGVSMEQTFHSRDRVAISKVWTYIKGLKSGDIIVCKYMESGTDQTIIKRIIGIAGDHIVIKGGIVKKNGQVLYEPYVQGYTEGDLDSIVPQETVFVMGDNREISKDSRLIGCIPIKQVEGRVLMRWYPFTQIKWY